MSYGNAETKNQLIERIEKVAKTSVATLNDWERGFLSSLITSTKKWGRLTARQHDTLQRIEKKHSPERLAQVSAWREAYDDDKRAMAQFAARYYKANPPYFADAVYRILSNESYVPSEKLYRKMVENKYVQRALKNAESAPKHAVGTMATIRNSKSITDFKVGRHRGKNVIVLAVEEEVLDATKGARKVTVLPVGEVHPIITEERWLKACR